MRIPDPEKVQYFATSLAKSLAGRGFVCPSCGDERSNVVSRKYLEDLGAMSRWASGVGHVVGGLDGWELLVASRKLPERVRA